MSEDIGGLFSMIGMAGSYDPDEAGDRIGEKVQVDGLEVSTCNTPDAGYETAIIDANTVYPVERYDTEEEAVEGHSRWIEKAPSLKTITHIGYGDLVEDREVMLKRSASD